MTFTAKALQKALAGRIEIDISPEACGLFGEDVFHAGPPVLAVARPEDDAGLVALLGEAERSDLLLTMRGGGASYSGGYLSPEPARTVAIDMSAMNKVVEIADDAMFVVVEAGCTWAALDAALAPHGLRAAWWGPMSGRHATIGGSLSQNALFWGSGQSGFAADAVLGLEVMTAAGETIRTGSLAIAGASGFCRHFGPDLTGPFLGDCGTLGIKLRMVLRLVRRPVATMELSFATRDFAGLAALLSNLAREGIGAQLVGFDKGLQEQRVSRIGLADRLRGARDLVSAGLLHPAKWPALARMAFAGGAVPGSVEWSAHIFLEGRSPDVLAADASFVRLQAARLGCWEIAPTVPAALAASPFPGLNGLTGPAGERWAPVHAIVPHDKAVAAQASVATVLARHAEGIARLGIQSSTLFSTCSTNAFVIEPMFFWREGPGAFHRTALSAGRIAAMVQDGSSAEARTLVETMRREIISTVDALGAAHIQLGATYPYRSRIAPATLALQDALRRHCDPHGHLNPGALRT